MTTDRYEARDATGALHAVHCRIGTGQGKRVWWELPDGTRGLGDWPLADLPLYGIHLLDKRPTVVITEGEKAAQSLIDRGIPAVGTVTGASATPGRKALAELTGRYVILWPDNDDVGRAHMDRVGGTLAEIGVLTYLVLWPDAPEHGDAADCADPEPLIAAARLWERPWHSEGRKVVEL